MHQLSSEHSRPLSLQGNPQSLFESLLARTDLGTEVHKSYKGTSYCQPKSAERINRESCRKLHFKRLIRLHMTPGVTSWHLAGSHTAGRSQQAQEPASTQASVACTHPATLQHEDSQDGIPILAPTPALRPASAYSCSPTNTRSPRKGILRKWVRTRKRQHQVCVTPRDNVSHPLSTQVYTSSVRNHSDPGAKCQARRGVPLGPHRQEDSFPPFTCQLLARPQTQSGLRTEAGRLAGASDETERSQGGVGRRGGAPEPNLGVQAALIRGSGVYTDIPAPRRRRQHLPHPCSQAHPTASSSSS